MLFCRRVADFSGDAVSNNKYKSPTCDMLRAAKRMGLLNIVINMVEGNLPIISKKAWSKLVWEKAWTLEDVFWDTSKLIHKDNDLLHKSVGHTRYMSWWKLAGLFPPLMRVCECLARLICHASTLKRDDVRLKGMSVVNRV